MQAGCGAGAPCEPDRYQLHYRVCLHPERKKESSPYFKQETCEIKLAHLKVTDAMWGEIGGGETGRPVRRLLQMSWL